MSITLLVIYAMTKFHLVGTLVENMASLIMPFIPEEALSYGRFLETYSHSFDLVDPDFKGFLLSRWMFTAGMQD